MTEKTELAFYMLTWATKTYLMQLMYLDTVEEAADVFDHQPVTWYRCLRKTHMPADILLTKYLQYKAD